MRINRLVTTSINRYKAQLEAKGYAQTHDIDYEETFALVAKMTIVHVLLAVAAAKEGHLHHMLEEHVYMVQPSGFLSKLNTSTVCQLKKSRYVLKQAPELGMP